MSKTHCLLGQRMPEYRMRIRFFYLILLGFLNHGLVAAPKAHSTVTNSTTVQSSTASGGSAVLYTGPEFSTCNPYGGPSNQNVFSISSRTFSASFVLSEPMTAAYRVDLIAADNTSSLVKEETQVRSFVAGKNALQFEAPADTQTDQIYSLRIYFSNATQLCLSAYVIFNALTEPTNVGSAADPTGSFSTGGARTIPLNGFGSGAGGCELRFNRTAQAQMPHALTMLIALLSSLYVFKRLRRKSPQL